MHADAGFVSCLLGWGAAGAGSVPCAYARAEFFLLFCRVYTWFFGNPSRPVRGIFRDSGCLRGKQMLLLIRVGCRFAAESAASNKKVVLVRDHGWYFISTQFGLHAWYYLRSTVISTRGPYVIMSHRSEPNTWKLCHRCRSIFVDTHALAIATTALSLLACHQINTQHPAGRLVQSRRDPYYYRQFLFI